MEWTTFQGKKASTESIDHQHLSNCYWYAKIIMKANEDYLNTFVRSAKDRFNGQILPYRPHVDFQWEIEFLYHLGLLRYVNKHKTEIVYKGEVIGEILRPYGDSTTIERTETPEDNAVDVVYEEVSYTLVIYTGNQ